MNFSHGAVKISGCDSKANNGTLADGVEEAV